MRSIFEKITTYNTRDIIWINNDLSLEKILFRGESNFVKPAKKILSP